MSLSNKPLRKYYYVAWKQTYEELGDGTVKVTAQDGRTGVFKPNGQYVSGELTQASLHMLVWTGGASLPDGCNFRWPEVTADIDRESGWPEHLEQTLAHHLG